MCPKCMDKKRSYCVECWFGRYLEHRHGLSDHELESIEFYRNVPISRAIEASTKSAGLELLDDFENIKEAYSYELAILFTARILAEQPPYDEIFKVSRAFTLKRKNSWFNLLLRQRESIQVQHKPYIFEYDDDNRIIDIAFADPEWVPPVKPPNPYNLNPEQFLIACEEIEKVRMLPSVVGSFNHKHARVCQRILEAQLAGGRVLREYAYNLGIEEGVLSSLKHRALLRAREIMANEYPDLAEKQEVFRARKGTKHKIVRSRFQDRKDLYRDQNTYLVNSRVKRIWKVIEGKKVSIAEAAILSAVVELKDSGR